MPDLDPIVVQMRQVREKRRRWSLREAGEKTGLTGTAIGSYERGDRVPPLTVARQWVEGYGLRLMVLGGPAEPTPAADGVQTWIEYAVAYGGGGRIGCADHAEAAAIAAAIPDSRVVCRLVLAGDWREEGSHV